MKAGSNLTRIFIALLFLGQSAAIPPKRSVAAHPDARSRRNDDALVDPSIVQGHSLPQHPTTIQQQQSTNLSSQVLKEHESKVASQVHHRSQITPSSTALSKKRTVFVTSMAFVTGCVDTVCYHRYKCFVNMMTGNTIKFATALAESRWADAVFHVSLIFSYVVGVGIFRAVDLQVRHGTKKNESTQLLPIVAPMILSLFVMTDVVSRLFANNRRLNAPLLSIGFGMMNAASADATGGTILYAMTGHLNRMGKTLVDYLMLSKTKCFRSFKSHLRIVCCFAAGIFMSTKAAQYLVPLGLQLPMATTAGIVFAALFLWYGAPV